MKELNVINLKHYKELLTRGVFWTLSNTSERIFGENSDPDGIYLPKFSNRNITKRYEICSKLTIKTPKRRLASFWCLYF